ncbi:MAG: DUF5700 domain-containing putative Zn-dependent protease [Candidatus Sulfotelmatobacter sp.]
MFTIRWLALVLPFQLLLSILVLGQATQSPATASRILLALNADEAESVLAILDKRGAGGNVTVDDWQHLFATEPYQQLKKRETSLHRDFTDDDFKKFVMSPELAAKAFSLRHTLDVWRQADLEASARRVLNYLPQQAHIKAKIFPMIKPKTNSFVFETPTNPMIFLYLDPDESAAKFENTVAHELHHIGLASVDSQIAAKLKDLPANVRPAVDWMSAFGEGFAMLAAAGGPDVDPHATSSPADRARWEHDLSDFNQNLELLQNFFLDVIHQKIKGKDQIDEKAFTFFGVQGPWYTVGYKMAVVIERRYGRKRLIECMLDPGDLLATYNRAAAEINKSGKENLALWSPELMEKICVPAASKKHSAATKNGGIS